ncbi:MAG: iron chelate uptake ABC transporter family permease subunit [Planctomycetota bacterium]
MIAIRMIAIQTIGRREKFPASTTTGRKSFSRGVRESRITLLVASLLLFFACPVTAYPMVAVSGPIPISQEATESHVGHDHNGHTHRAPMRSGPPSSRQSEWPTWEDIWRVFSLQDYNVRIVLFGVTMLGCAAGMVGSFTLLRKRALMGDAISHSTLPGIAIAFMIAVFLGYEQKSLIFIQAGATISGLAGVATILAMSRLTRLKEDTALGSVLGVFFGFGVVLLGITQQMSGSSTGLDSYVYGKTASMGILDAKLIAGAAFICILTSLLLFKELKLLCFDDDFAGSRGFPVTAIDMCLMAMVVVVVIVGQQAVGLILMIALLITPAAAARFWTERLGRMFFISGAIGAIGGLLGAGASALFSKLPSGAMIVLVCTAMFFFSMIFGSARGILVRLRTRFRVNRTVARQHLLRALFELLEGSSPSDSASVATSTAPKQSISFESILKQRSWSKHQLQKEIRRSQSDEYVQWVGDRLTLTRRGKTEAARLTRQHRLWELYLINYAEIAPSRVDRAADHIEHVLEPETVSELELLLKQEQASIPASPHQLAGSADGLSSTDGDNR